MTRVVVDAKAEQKVQRRARARRPRDDIAVLSPWDRAQRVVVDVDLKYARVQSTNGRWDCDEFGARVRIGTIDDERIQSGVDAPITRCRRDQQEGNRSA